MTDIPSIDSLQKEKNSKENSKVDIFNIVLSKCIEKIVYTNRHTDKTFIIFEVPKILIGYPQYDMRTCILFLISKLSAHKYLIEFIDPFYLYIDWGSVPSSSTKTASPSLPSSLPTQLKKQTHALLKKFPDTSQVEFVYQDDKLKHQAKRKPKKKGKK